MKELTLIILTVIIMVSCKVDEDFPKECFCSETVIVNGIVVQDSFFISTAIDCSDIETITTEGFIVDSLFNGTIITCN